MITLEQTMDPHSLEIVDETNIHLGYVQWHPGREPRIVLTDDHSELSANEMWDCLRALNKQGKFHPPQDRPMT